MSRLFAYLRRHLTHNPFDLVTTTPEPSESQSELNFTDEVVRVTIETSKGKWVWSGAANLHATITSQIAGGTSSAYVNRRTGEPAMTFTDHDRITAVGVALSFYATEVGNRRSVEFWPTGYVPTEESD